MDIREDFFKEQIHRVTHPLPGSIPVPTRYRLPVKKKYEGLNIIDFFLTVVPRSTKDIWLKKINDQTLLINGKPASLSTLVKGGDITEHISDPRTEPFVNTQIDLLFSDDNLLILNKPAPLPMHPSGRFNKNSLTEILKLAFPTEDFKIIHRLDANTTGIVVLARNKEIVQVIGKQFENKQAQKTYLALVEGIPAKNCFSTNTKIGIEKTAGGGRALHNDGQESFTEFQVLERRENLNQTLLKVTPHTGRTNQIRLHLAQLEFPIVGDVGYKDSQYFKNNPLTYNSDCLSLHAWELCFNYQDKPLKITTKIPDKFKFCVKL